MMTDPIGDMLTRIRNAGRVRHAATSCPSSKLKLSIAKVLSDEGFIGEFRAEVGDEHKPTLHLNLRYTDAGAHMIDGIKRVSKPGRRVYVASDEIPKVRNGLGMAVLSTSKGVMCDRDAREQKLGGELICEVW
jgi:small subunit ribosomal protein S8